MIPKLSIISENFETFDIFSLRHLSKKNSKDHFNSSRSLSLAVIQDCIKQNQINQQGPVVIQMQQMNPKSLFYEFFDFFCSSAEKPPSEKLNETEP